MSKAAPKTRLEELHDQLARVLAEAIHEREVKVIELPDESAEGGTRKVTVHTRNAAILNAARQFLKDNNIEAPVGGTAALNDLKNEVSKLPFGEDPLDTTPGQLGNRKH
jgi:hypothetical protein